MKRLALTYILATFLLPHTTAHALGGDIPNLDAVRIDLSNKPWLQNGARLFVNYCLSCHSAAFMRYNRMGRDLGISDANIEANLLFAGEKLGDLMIAVMPPKDASDWFGVAPPDLSLAARARKPEWLYTYLRTFYLDEKSPSGWNNRVFPNVAMPHILYELQGDQRAIFKKVKQKIQTKSKDGKVVEREIELEEFDRFELVRPGKLTPEEFDAAMRDLTNFLVYLAEPAKLERYTIGIYVILFLFLLLGVSYLLKKEYWRDIH